ncbi:MAG: imidazole glycerol phosphate synthase subunit HisF [Deltaproteobacteria bacterium]|nr:imidazole glycerol phosphate synthase subunit HisF [Deltaproteobacteria bacterium]
MLRARVLPCLLLRGSGFVKTTKFEKPIYLGDPRNVVKIFNEKEVDEFVILDINATRDKRGPNMALLGEIVNEAFVPVGYGGGVQTLQQIEALFKLGVEKVVINTYAAVRPDFVTEAARRFGSQSIVVSIDAKRSVFGRYEVMTLCGTHRTGEEPVRYARRMVDAGAGELMVTSIDRDGTMSGYDLELTAAVSRAVSVPLVACGGCGSVRDIERVVLEAGAAAAAAGSFFVFQGKHRAVLISFPTPGELGKVRGTRAV